MSAGYFEKAHLIGYNDPEPNPDNNALLSLWRQGGRGVGSRGKTVTELALRPSLSILKRVPERSTERGSAELRQAQLPRSPSKPHAEVLSKDGA